MSTTIFTQTEEVLSQSNKYKSSDGKLLRNAVLEAAEKMDAELLSILLKNDLTKKTYFTEVNDIQVFDKQKFAWIIQNKNFLPDSYTRYKNKIGLVDSRGDFISSSNDVELVFPYKDCILEGGQTKEDQKNNEIFYNETLAPDQVSNLLAPKAFCNAKKYDKDGVHEVTEISDTDNLIIKGNNLLALSSMLEKYKGMVKCIYIDVPYNTGSDSFGYNDRFNHSTWLTFMKNRLEYAKKLLRDDGCIFVQCDDNEQAYLQVLMNEIFDFIQIVEIKMNEGAANEFQNPFMPKNCEYGLLYAKNYESRKYKPLWVERDYDKAYNKFIVNKDEESDFKKWEVKTVKEVINEQHIEENKITQFVIDNSHKIFRGICPKGAGSGLSEAMKRSALSDSWDIYERENYDNIYTYKGEMVRFYEKNIGVDKKGKKVILKELGSLWNDIKTTGIAPEGGVKLKNGKKPEALLERIIEMLTEQNDIVLDYHLGSGTTAAVAHKMGRRYIGIEQLDYGENDSVVRLQNVINGDQTGISKSQNWQGGGSFVYCELAKLNQSFADKIQSCKTDSEIKSLTDEILKSDFVSSKVKPSEINTNVKDYSDLSLEEKQKFAMELLDKNQLYVNFSERNDPDMKLSENDIKFTESFYGEKK